MDVLKTNDGTDILSQGLGTRGSRIVFHHGWPLSSDDWDTQNAAIFLDRGYRVIAHDRRGRGRFDPNRDRQ